jgi:hypothetical protein
MEDRSNMSRRAREDLAIRKMHNAVWEGDESVGGPNWVWGLAGVIIIALVIWFLPEVPV